MFGVALVLTIVYLLHRAIVVRKVAFFLSLAVFVVFIFATIFALTERSAAEVDNRAVILTTDTTPVHASPDSGSKIIREPSQGVTVEVERTQNEWSEVRFADGEKGWVRTATLEII